MNFQYPTALAYKNGTFRSKYNLVEMRRRARCCLGVQGLYYTTLGPRFAGQCPGATLGCCGLGGVKLSGSLCQPASPRPGVAPPHHAPPLPSPALPAPPLKPGAAAAQAAASWRQANALSWSRRS